MIRMGEEFCCDSQLTERLPVSWVGSDTLFNVTLERIKAQSIHNERDLSPFGCSSTKVFLHKGVPMPVPK